MIIKPKCGMFKGMFRHLGLSSADKGAAAGGPNVWYNSNTNTTVGYFGATTPKGNTVTVAIAGKATQLRFYGQASSAAVNCKLALYSTASANALLASCAAFSLSHDAIAERAITITTPAGGYDIVPGDYNIYLICDGDYEAYFDNSYDHPQANDDSYASLPPATITPVAEGPGIRVGVYVD